MTVRYFFTVTMLKTRMVLSTWNFIGHLLLLAGEAIALNTIQQELVHLFRKVFWIRTFIVCFFGLLGAAHYFMSVFDLITNYGLLMRFGGDMPMSYYLVPPPQLFEQKLPEEGQQYKESVGAAFVKHCMEAQKTETVLILGWLAFLCLLVVVRGLYVIIRSYCMKPKAASTKKPFLSLKVKRIITVVMVAIFGAYCLSYNGDKFDDFTPVHWFFYRTSLRHDIPLDQYLETVKHIREKFHLPEGEDWIDQRDVPVYPFVHGPKAIADAYNKHIPSELPTKNSSMELPNVVVLLWESLTPSPKYLRDEVIMNKERLLDGQPYRTFFLPKLAELAEQGHTFLNVRSNGVPTINGWHSLVTGEISNSININMVASYYNDFDDFPTRFKDLGYYNLILWPCNFRVDKNENYIYRGKKQLRGPDYVGKFPMWFDEIHNFYPTKEEADMMGIEEYPKKQNYWTNDRLSSQMFNYFFNQRVKDQKKPIFGFYGNVDTHEDFTGYDDDEQYIPFNVGKGRSDPYSAYGRHDSYSTVLRYSDHQFGRIFENIRKNAPNTIILIMGDHGSRQVPVYLDADKRINEESPIYYDTRCNGRSIGGDQAFMTSAVMAYFGDNPIIKERFDAIKNKTSLEPADHQDVILTLMNILEDVSGNKVPTSRLGTDLFEQVKTLMRGERPYRNPKISTSHLSLEYNDNEGYYRFSLLTPKQGYEITTPLPSCIAGKDSINLKPNQAKYYEARRMIQLTNHLAQNNMYFNYKFRDVSCVKTGTCEFQDPNPPFDMGAIPRLMRATAILAAKLTFVLFVLVSVLQVVNFIGRKIIGAITRSKEQTAFPRFGQLLVDSLIVKSSNCDEITF